MQKINKFLTLLNDPARYIKRKIKNIYEKINKKRSKKTDNEVYNEENLKRKSINELKEIAKLRRIKSSRKLKRSFNYQHFKIRKQ